MKQTFIEIGNSCGEEINEGGVENQSVLAMEERLKY